MGSTRLQDGTATAMRQGSFSCTYFGVALRTLRPQGTSAPRHFGTNIWCRSVPDISAPVPKCLKTLRHRCRNVQIVLNTIQYNVILQLFTFFNADCAMHDQSWAGHREPLMAGPAGRRTTPVVCRCPAMVSSRTLFCWRKISRCGVQSDYEWTAVYLLLWLSLHRPICLWPWTTYGK